MLSCRVDITFGLCILMHDCPINLHSDDSGSKINTKGYIVLWRRYLARLNCPMDFGMFPFDTQTCEFKIHLSK